LRIDAAGIYYRDLNDRIHAAMGNGEREFVLENVRGQRYLGTGLGDGVKITINGVPGNDLGAFMNGAEVIVNGNGQDGVGNTMNAGRIVIRGDAGDVLGHSMRGGHIFVRGDAGYRTGIHMKEYRERFPVLVVGGTVRDYLGEYMAGGILAVLGLNSADGSPVGEFVGTGMHGGVIYIRGGVEPYQLGKEVGPDEIKDQAWQTLERILADYAARVGMPAEFRREEFIRLLPKSTRPYGKLYAY